MRLLKYLFPLWVVILVYSLLSFFHGSSGFSAYDGLKTERDKQLANLEALKKIRGELEGNRDALLYDEDTIAVYARELGYGMEGERFVRIAGLSKTMRRQYWAGEVAGAQMPPSMDEKTIRTISLAAGGIVLGFIFFTRILKMII
ncbi:MAG: septum formation initiator family protein [Treponema sp.]|jgi:cell division protein FtsB|nr:septum formation initiator family protein [Treponema sp.]